MSDTSPPDRIAKAAVLGSIDTLSIEDSQIILSGWVLENGRPVGDLLLSINGKEHEFSRSTSARPDLIKGFGEQAASAGFVLRAPLKLTTFEFPREIRVTPAHVQDFALPINPESHLQQLIAVFTKPGAFWTHVQNPAERIKHDGTLMYAAHKALAVHHRDPLIQASSICVIAWRYLLRGGDGLNIRRIVEFGHTALGRLNNNDTVLGTRWYTSLANVLAFCALEMGDLDQAMRHFSHVEKRTERFSGTWIGTVNGTTARFMGGYIALMRNDKATAQQQFEASHRFVNNRLPFFNVDNFWSFDELLEVARLGQQSFQIYEMLRTNNTSSRLNAGSDFEASAISTHLIKVMFQREVLPKLSIKSIIEANTNG
ncbi:hypothetical protein ILT44_21315 [Microvirga sp. BT689]|uniref:hypothetical protein n=1 Tax=Microvirga arvi TaxID=2778731 RepID=UPI00194E741B|nr:hypothetical protein [Microvirga arvi]MBM6582749.1 hypothetical protein [Microvirga arvi]